MTLPPTAIFKCLADETRLRTLLLLNTEGELCVCEIAASLELSQPKVSRHLAQLRNQRLLSDRRQGQWIYYRLTPQLSPWVIELLRITAEANPHSLHQDQQRLERMGDRPQRQADCC